MSGWDSTRLLEYMSRRSKFYGKKWKHISSAEHFYLAKCFTDSVLKHLDISSQNALPFVHIQYEGKGDPCGVKIDPDYCFTDNQINNLMNFLCCEDCNDSFTFFLSDYISFKIEMYLLYSVSLYKDWLHSLRVAVSKGDI